MISIQSSEAEWEKMRGIYEISWAQTQSPIQVIKVLREQCDLRLAFAKDIFDRLHYREYYPQRRRQVEEIWKEAAEVFSKAEHESLG